MLLDLDMPRLGGLEVLKRLPTIKQAEDIPVIVMTAHGSIEAAVEAMKHGAYDFLTKPLDKDHLLIVIGKALERASLKRQVACLKSEVDSRYASIIGTSTKIGPSWKLLSGPRNRTPACSAGGERHGQGTARAVHSSMESAPRHAAGRHQLRRLDARPYWKTNCSVMSAAPSPAPTVCKKASLKWPMAAPCFFDEIGDMSLPLQVKLLRVLQDREFHRVGGTRLVSVNIRIIAATNKELKQAVKAGDFREDLFFRLNVIGLTLPPLRERLEDFPALAKFFLSRHAKEAKRPGMWFSPAALDAWRAIPGRATFGSWTMSSPGPSF